MANIELAHAMAVIQQIRSLSTIWRKEFTEKFVQRLDKV